MPEVFLDFLIDLKWELLQSVFYLLATGHNWVGLVHWVKAIIDKILMLVKVPDCTDKLSSIAFTLFETVDVVLNRNLQQVVF